MVVYACNHRPRPGGRLRQEDRSFEKSPSYTVNLRAAWARWWDPVSIKQPPHKTTFPRNWNIKQQVIWTVYGNGRQLVIQACLLTQWAPVSIRDPISKRKLETQVRKIFWHCLLASTCGPASLCIQCTLVHSCTHMCVHTQTHTKWKGGYVLTGKRKDGGRYTLKIHFHAWWS